MIYLFIIFTYYNIKFFASYKLPKYTKYIRQILISNIVIFVNNKYKLDLRYDYI